VVTRPKEWGADSFIMARRDTLKEWAASDVFPRWLRVTWAAYARLEGNGHAPFRQQELAGILGDEINGVWIPARRQRVREAIDGAIERHLLLTGSKALCLVVPRSAVVFGVGNPDAPCRRHPAKRNAESVSPDLETTRFQPVVSPPKERSNRVVSGSRPLISLPTPTTKDREIS
jgi:hypothetical protein